MEKHLVFIDRVNEHRRISLDAKLHAEGVKGTRNQAPYGEKNAIKASFASLNHKGAHAS